MIQKNFQNMEYLSKIHIYFFMIFLLVLIFIIDTLFLQQIKLHLNQDVKEKIKNKNILLKKNN